MKKIEGLTFLFDKRIAERNVKKKLISQKQYEEFLKSLPDERDNCESIKIETDIQYDA